MTELVQLARDVPRAGCWRLVLDDPANANALSAALVAHLRDALQQAFAGGARAILLDSTGGRFCGGFDLRDVERVGDDELRKRFVAVEDLLETVRRAPALTIAVVRGAALGAGADLVAACDYRIGTDVARFAFPGARFGVVLGTRHLAAVVGRKAALDAVVEGRTLDAARAAACGLLTEICAEDALAARVDDIVHRSEAIDAETLRAVLRLTRDAASDRDRSELLASVSRPGLADRIRAHARRVHEERSARRASAR
jgi:enoyl-CoA hydratase/carnithine racemase